MEINFNDLSFEEVERPDVVRRKTHKVAGKITLEQLGVPKKLSASEAKELRDELHKIEPGNKIAVKSVGTIIGQWCEHCNTETMHVLKFDHSKIRCMNCKKDRKLKTK